MSKAFNSVKLFDGYSTVFRQWKAESTHCKYLHGYGVSVRVTFAGSLDSNNWVWDFGGLKRATTKIDSLNPKEWLDYLYSNFDFKSIKVHALGVTTRWCLQRYPFYSVDSSSALSITRYPSSDKKNIMYQKTKHYTELYQVGIDPILELERNVTRLWESRGIVWN